MKAVLLCVIVQQPGQGGGPTPPRYLLLYMRHAGDFYHNSTVTSAVGLSKAGPIGASTLTHFNRLNCNCFTLGCLLLLTKYK